MTAYIEERNRLHLEKRKDIIAVGLLEGERKAKEFAKGGRKVSLSVIPSQTIKVGKKEDTLMNEILAGLQKEVADLTELNAALNAGKTVADSYEAYRDSRKLTKQMQFTIQKYREELLIVIESRKKL